MGYGAAMTMTQLEIAPARASSTWTTLRFKIALQLAVKWKTVAIRAPHSRTALEAMVSKTG